MSQVLESLKSIADIGVQQVKPFKNWAGSPLQEQIWSFWVLNVGAVQDAQEAVDGISGRNSQIHALKLEIIARAIVAIDGRILATEEDVQTFNRANNTNLSLHQYKIMHLRELEDLVLSRLDAIYADLLAKQARAVQGTSLCEVCGRTYLTKELGPHVAKAEYSVADIICDACMSVENKKEHPTSDAAPDEAVGVTSDKLLRCQWCNKPVYGSVELEHHESSCSLNPQVQ